MTTNERGGVTKRDLELATDIVSDGGIKASRIHRIAQALADTRRAAIAEAMESEAVKKLRDALVQAKAHVDVICSQLDKDGWGGPTGADLTQRLCENALEDFDTYKKSLSKNQAKERT